MAASRKTRPPANETPEQKKARQNRERQARFREKKKGLEAATQAASRGDTETIEALQGDGVPVFLQHDMDAEYQRGYDDGFAEGDAQGGLTAREQAASSAYLKGLRDGFAGGRLLEQLLDMFLDDAELYEEDEMRKTLKGNRHIESVVRERLVTSGVPRDSYLLWLGRI